MSQQWFIKTKQGEVGPVTPDKLRQLATDGKLKPNSLIRRGGMSQWVNASRAEGLFAKEEPQKTAPPPDSPPRVPEDAERESPAIVADSQRIEEGHRQSAASWKDHLRSNAFPSIVLLLAFLGGTVYGICVTPSLLKKDFSVLAQEEAGKTEDIRKQHEQRLTSRIAILETEVSAINATALRRSALEKYNKELAGRDNYDKRFALSPRERAQLQMQTLANDSTRSFIDAIRAVAQEASPKGADIGVRESSRGIALHIDFDMSSLTSGEHGNRTKHHTKESLRKEVISLTSRVTNDMFQFCKDLELEAIHVGCRHIVGTKHQYGDTRDENMVLYKIRIQKNQVQKLTNNPFLDVYSTTRHFEVEEDNFENIEIITTRL